MSIKTAAAITTVVASLFLQIFDHGLRRSWSRLAVLDDHIGRPAAAAANVLTADDLHLLTTVAAVDHDCANRTDGARGGHY